MDTARIRPVSVCLFRHEGRILVSEGFDEVDESYFYRPLGGGVEYGETSEAAVKREMVEELDARIENVKLVCVLENIFNYRGELGHEIVFVFDGEFEDKSFYEREAIDGFEHEAGVRFKAKWMSPGEISLNGGHLVPDGLTTYLEVET